MSLTFIITAALNGTGYFSYGDHDVICKPAMGWMVLILFLFNYAAHCLTIRTLPGESTSTKLVAVLTAFFFQLPAWLGQ